MKKYDVLIIGSGQGGTPLAKKFAGKGYDTALIERRWVGGTCVNDGCTPTKAMAASAKTMYLLSRAKEMGVSVAGFSADISAIADRQQKMVKQFREGSEKKLKKTKNLDLIFGNASFTGPKRITVTRDDGDKMSLEGDLVFIDTGTRPFIPAIEGLDKVQYLTSGSILQLRTLPEHLLIIGAGYVALEFGQMYRRFGSKVTMLERSDRILRREDEDMSSEILALLEQENIDVRLNSEVANLTQKNGIISAVIRSGGSNETISCSHVLLATGRVPNTDTLNPGAAGVRLNKKGFVEVNDQLNTDVPGIFALGDVTGGPAFTHISYNDYVILYKNLLEKGHEHTRDRLVPYCMYIDPQFARVGMTEAEARAKGLKIKVATLPMAHVARAIETGDTRGKIKAIVDAATDKILGVAVLGQEGGELMSLLQIAMTGGVTAGTLKDAIFAHPTYAEALNNLFLTLE